MTLNDFSKYYKTISNTELLTILDNPGDYQSTAIEAARKEFIDRKLSDTEVNEAKESLLARHLQKEKQRETVKAIEEKVKTGGQTLLDTLNPIEQGTPPTEKIIRLIVIVFGFLFLYLVIQEFRMIPAYVQDIPEYPFRSVLYFLPFILLPIAIFTFWKRRTVGWTLLVIFLTFSAVAALWLLIQSFLWQASSISVFDNSFFPPELLTTSIRLLFFAGALYTVCRQDMRDIFSINENKMITTISITGGLSFFVVYVNA
jgi:hypothetical protein